MKFQNVLLTLETGKTQPYWNKPSQTIQLGIENIPNGCFPCQFSASELVHLPAAGRSEAFLSFVDGESEVVERGVSAPYVYRARGGRKTASDPPEPVVSCCVNTARGKLGPLEEQPVI